MKFPKVLTFVLIFVWFPTLAQAYWVWSPEESKFVNSETESQDAADEQYHYAMQFYNEKNLDEAIKQFERLLETYPGAPIAAEAQYRLGVIYEEKDDFGKAFNAYKRILESYPQSDRLHEVIEREFRIGNLFLSGKKGKLMGLEILPSNAKAVEVFKHIVDHAPYSEYGDKAQLRLGLTYKKMGKFTEAMEAFQTLLDQYPQSELLEEARFQLAQTSFQRSTVQFRDQRALDDASTEIDSFLTQYPDAATSEEAARLRQEIDEKNAEKNYRIGLYYEKTNYVQSALIYYSDIARRYPHTKWGQKSIDKMKSLEAPAEHITQAQKEIRTEIETVEKQMEAVQDQGSVEYAQLKRLRERLDKKEENVEKNKEETLKSRRDDLARRETEIKGKYRNLKKKQKLLKKNPSEDLKKALERWELSLEAEKAALADEKSQVADWHHALGVKMDRSPLDLVPFLGEGQTELEKVRAIEAKKFFKLASEKKEILSEKELLYKHHSEVLSMLGDMDNRTENFAQTGKNFEAIAQEGTVVLSERQKQLEGLRQEIGELEKEVEMKRAIYEKEFGSNWDWLKSSHQWVTKPAAIVASPLVKSFSLMNPFDSSSRQLEDLTLDQLLERQMHVKEKIAAQQSLVETLAQAFDSELALKERQRLLAQLESDEDVDVHVLRKEIRKTEKEIRSRYEEIKDRHRLKKDLLKELDAVVKNVEERQSAVESAVTSVARPASGIVRLSKAFFFGLEPQDVTLTKQAAAMQMLPEESESAAKIRETLGQESLLIEARYMEIKELEKELEILKARASLAGGYNFRSALVKLPYSFIREAVESANRLLPKEGKEEALIGLLDKESKELEDLRQESARIKQLIDTATAVEAPAAEAVQAPEPEAAQAEKAEMETAAIEAAAKPAASQEEDAMRREIELSLGKLKKRQKVYETQNEFLEKEQQAYEKKLNRKTLEKLRSKEGQVLTKEEENLRQELEDIESTLGNLIQKENNLEEEESSILWKRIELIDKLSQKMVSRAMVQDLMVERKRMEERLEQIDLRRDFLNRERERFQMQDFPAQT